MNRRKARESHAQSPFCGRNNDEMTDKGQDVWSAENEQRHQVHDETGRKEGP